MLLKAPFVCNGCKKRTSCRLEKHLYRAKDADKQYREMLSDSRTGIALNKQSFYRADEILYLNPELIIYTVKQTDILAASPCPYDDGGPEEDTEIDS